MQLQLTDEQKLALKIKLVKEQIEQRRKLLDPSSYGLPKIHFPQLDDETDKQFRARREEAVRCIIEDHLFFVKDGVQRKIKLIPEQLRLVTDMLYGYCDKAILWKSRGGGGSLMAAIIIWMSMVFNNRSFTDMAGSGDQAKAVYEYTCQFWDCIPGFKQRYLAQPPLQSATITNGGAKLQCVACSEKAVRGKHTSGFVADESCQENDQGGNVFRSAMQIPMSEEDHMILLLSTFHHPFGFFADHWDGAEELGFTRYKWDIYDTMERCEAKCDCLLECPLTRMADVKDPVTGKKLGEELIGCCGKARKNKHGYMTRERVIEIMKLNLGTDVFEVEFECARPGGKRKVIPAEAIDAATVRPKMIEFPPRPPEDQPSKWECLEKKIEYIPKWDGKVGIDWGFASPGGMCMVLVLKCKEYISVLDTRFMSGKLVSSVMEVLRAWEEEYDFTFEIYADSSHPFNNAELTQNGFSCLPVNFKTYKDIGYQNLQKYFAHQKVRLVADTTPVLRDQLKKLKRDAAGKIVKKEDHGPDAFMCAMLGYPIPEVFPEVMAVDEDAEKRREKKKRDQDRGCVLIGA